MHVAIKDKFSKGLHVLVKRRVKKRHKIDEIFFSLSTVYLHQAVLREMRTPTTIVAGRKVQPVLTSATA